MNQRYLILFLTFQSSVHCYNFQNKNNYESSALKEALGQIVNDSYGQLASEISITTRNYQNKSEMILLNDVLTDFLITVQPHIKVHFVNFNFQDTNKYRFNIIFAKDLQTFG